MFIRPTTDQSGTSYQLARENGRLVRCVDCSVFTTRDEVFAREALAFLTKPLNRNGKRTGPQRLKSLFGVL